MASYVTTPWKGSIGMLTKLHIKTSGPPAHSFLHFFLLHLLIQLPHRCDTHHLHLHWGICADSFWDLNFHEMMAPNTEPQTWVARGWERWER